MFVYMQSAVVLCLCNSFQHSRLLSTTVHWYTLVVHAIYTCADEKERLLHTTVVTNTALQQLPGDDVIACAVLGFEGWKLQEHPIPHHVRHPPEVYLTKQVESYAKGDALLQYLAYLRS
jgi:hypothetical protein